MFSADEQSNVPRVFIVMTVGTPALAVVAFGKYPPLALIVIICLPSTMLTLPATCGFLTLEPLLPIESKIIPPTRTTMVSIDITITFVFMVLEIKNGLDNARRRQGINNVKHSKKDYDEPRCFEKYSRLRFFMDAQRAKT